jgi:hypothetical protein
MLCPVKKSNPCSSALIGGHTFVCGPAPAHPEMILAADKHRCTPMHADKDFTRMD